MPSIRFRILSDGDTTSIAALIGSPGADNAISLREAISAANNTGGADTITFDANVFSGNANSLIRLGGTELVISESLTIDGSSATDVVISGDAAMNDRLVTGTFITDVDASLANNPNSLNDNSRVINFDTSRGSLTLRALTVTGGRVTSDDGGGIRFEGDGALTLDQSTVSGNSGTGSAGGIYAGSGSVTLNSSTVNGNRSSRIGGGIYARSGPVMLTSSTVSGNRSSNPGGGVYTNSGAVMLTSSRISGNSSNSVGGGIYTNSGPVTLNGSNVTGNRSGSDGGGIYSGRGSVTLSSSIVSANTSVSNGGGISASNGTVILTNSTVSGNSSGRNGGGIYAYSRPVILSGSTVSANRSNGDGGGIYSARGATEISNSTISGNTSTGSNADGGGIATISGNVTLNSSTVTNNSSGGNGGGVYSQNSGASPLLTVQNSIIAGNIATGAANDLLPDPTSTLDIDFSLIGDTTGSGVTAGTGTGNVLDANPLLGPLQDNGGPTHTHALLAGSPALDAGNSTLITDQRGLTRPVDLTATANAAGGDGSDIGAFEFQPEPSSLVVTTNLDVVDNADFVTSLREAINFANSQAGADTITFDSTVFTGDAASLIRLKSGTLIVNESLTIDGTGGTDVVISGDAEGSDTLVTGTFITDVAASLTADPTSLDDNTRVVNFSAFSGDLTLNNLTITGGRTSFGFENGGGVRMNGSGTLAINSSTISGNSTSGANSIGGGIASDRAAITINGSTISGNSTAYGGGGIGSVQGAITLTRSTVSSNSSSADGGGIFAAFGTTSLISSTVTNNTSVGEGGGFFGFNVGAGPLLSIQNSIIAGNTASGAATDLRPDPTSTLDIDFSLIGDTTGSGVTGSTGTGNVLNTNPLLGPLADNGGPTRTHALLVGSPALDQGNSSLATDQRGFTRTVDFATIDNASGSNGSDIGAFELQPAQASLIVTTALDLVDNTDPVTSLREAISFANSNAGFDHDHVCATRVYRRRE